MRQPCWLARTRRQGVPGAGSPALPIGTWLQPVLWVYHDGRGPHAGCHWSLGPALSSELFGLRRFATLYCLLNYSTTLGAYLLAMRLGRPTRRIP